MPHRPAGKLAQDCCRTCVHCKPFYFKKYNEAKHYEERRTLIGPALTAIESMRSGKNLRGNIVMGQTIRSVDEMISTRSSVKDISSGQALEGRLGSLERDSFGRLL